MSDAARNVCVFRHFPKERATYLRKRSADSQASAGRRNIVNRSLDHRDPVIEHDLPVCELFDERTLSNFHR
jgi:hypothetical protein